MLPSINISSKFPFLFILLQIIIKFPLTFNLNRWNPRLDENLTKKKECLVDPYFKIISSLESILIFFKETEDYSRIRNKDGEKIAGLFSGGRASVSAF